ncbi:Cullin-domain-containing protein [Calocera cornea HHB12733]|uniref:Cullin-domain-containing protein n=1 Tax=Calocera cornea HHB12733 TaxID=1353952 RepID=A0A165FLQ5_9BASI|nr:Cullin-domain-containing protein [Calocera cornea HHB12733]
MWTRLSRAIQVIHSNGTSTLSFEENFRYAYNMVLFKQGDMLYNGVTQLVVENLNSMAKEQIVPVFPSEAEQDNLQKAQEGERLLKAVRKVWDDHKSNMSKLRDLLGYMDRIYCPANNVPVIYEAGMQLFLKHIIRTTVYPIRHHIITTILRLIDIERNGDVINRSAVRSCVEILMDLKDKRDGPTVYKLDFEPVFLKKSDDYYLAEARRLIDTCDGPTYLAKAERRLDQEKSRTDHYLSSTTTAPLQRILEDRFLVAHLTTVLEMRNSGLAVMIDQRQTEDLARLYRLALRVSNGIPELKRALKDLVSARGRDINALEGGVQDGEDADEDEQPKSKTKGQPRPGGASQSASVALKWVQNMLDLKSTFDHVHQEAFNNNPDVGIALHEAYESVINSNPKAPEYISLFIDDHLKKGVKGKTDAEVDAVLDSTITIFRFVTDKDVFEKYYKSHLAKRLINGRSMSDDAERNMLSKLKVECGFQFTQKMEGMFHDMKISNDTMNAYRQYLSKTENPVIDLSVMVLTSTFWPMAMAPSPCNFPAQMTEACKSFERFYLARHSGRKLTWQPSYGTADVRVSFKTKKHELNVATYALIILLLFENLPDGEQVSYEDLKMATLIPEIDLKRHLQSLACAKWKILKKHPPSRDVAEDDTFSFNHDFTAPLMRIKISTVASRVENADERQETKDRVDEERKHQTEACIVRVMKDRKKLGHNELVNEVTRQLATRFSPSPSLIKKRIEALIEREYLERADDRKSYIYLA